MKKLITIFISIAIISVLTISGIVTAKAASPYFVKNSTNIANTIELLNTMLNTDHKTVKVNNVPYNIIGYIAVNNCNKDNICDKFNIDHDKNIKALVLLDKPVIYANEYDEYCVLKSYRWVAYITDNYSSANIVTCAAVGENGTIVTDISCEYKHENKNFMSTTEKVYRVDYRSLIEQGIIARNKHWTID